MTEKKKEFDIGQVTTCQFGKASAPYGFKPFVQVEILDKKEYYGFMLYLVKHRNIDMVATAMVPDKEVCGELLAGSTIGYGNGINLSDAISEIWEKTKETT